MKADLMQPGLLFIEETPFIMSQNKASQWTLMPVCGLAAQNPLGSFRNTPPRSSDGVCLK